MKKVLLILAAIALLLAGGFLIGPKPNEPQYISQLPTVPQNGAALQTWLDSREQLVPHIKPDNEARIWWADSLQQPTPFAVVYLHGFSASQEEGAAMARAFAERYGCNLLLTRLQAHGLNEDEPLLNYNADSVYASALEALAMGKVLGQQVILMSTSTGGTLALKLSAEFPEIAANILYSPNIAIADPNAWLLSKPWGLQLARQVVGSDYQVLKEDDYGKKYWNTTYRLESTVALQTLVETSMTPKTFAAVKQPLFLGYYYKDEAHQDPTVSVAALLDMFAQLGTPEAQRRAVAFPEADAHVLANPHTSGSYEAVRDATFAFAEEILQLSIAPAPDMLP